MCEYLLSVNTSMSVSFTVSGRTVHASAVISSAMLGSDVSDSVSITTVACNHLGFYLHKSSVLYLLLSGTS